MRLWALILPVLFYEARGLRDSRAQDQQQAIVNIVGEEPTFSSRYRRSTENVADAG